MYTCILHTTYHIYIVPPYTTQHTYTTITNNTPALHTDLTHLHQRRSPLPSPVLPSFPVPRTRRTLHVPGFHAYDDLPLSRQVPAASLQVRSANACNNRDRYGRPLTVLITAVFRSVIRSRRQFNGALASDTGTRLASTAVSVLVSCSSYEPSSLKTAITVIRRIDEQAVMA